MYSLIVFLENAGYIVRIQVNPNQELKAIFFISEDAIKETRMWPEALMIDATYKTNAHKMSLVNIVGTSNVTAPKSGGILRTFTVAGAFINAETEEVYTWIMEELKSAVWPDGCCASQPSVFVTDNEQALRNAIDTTFPDSQHLLCSWHLWNTMKTKLPIGTCRSTEYNLRLTEAEFAFKEIVSSYNDSTYQEAVSKFERIITTSTYFKQHGMIGLEYLKDVYVSWVGRCNLLPFDIMVY